MFVRLFTSFYKEEHEGRKRELSECLQRNVNNPLIDEIILLCEDKFDLNIKSEKLKLVDVDIRPTFSVFFNEANKHVKEFKDVSIITNSDIFFEEKDVLIIKKYIISDQCYCLTRYDVRENGEMVFLNRRDSQDSWIFSGKIVVHDASFYLGRPGCDNHLAWLLAENGYSVKNPSKDIKSYHIHNTQVKTYTRCEEHVVKPPYLLLEPSFL